MVINKYTVTFNVTPSDATVNYSIDSESYDQTTTGTGTVSNIPHGSTIYYKISKTDYETITKSQVVNNNVTITENMVEDVYILVSTNSSGSAKLNKYTNQEGTRTESITIPASSTDYKVDDLRYGFRISSGYCIIKVDTTYLNTSNVTSMHGMFDECQNLSSLDVSHFDTSKVTNMMGMFYECNNLTSLDISNFDTSKVTNKSNMFNGCNRLTHIKCKQAFKDWCWTNQDDITLPTAMRSGGSGTWEIVG
jgi:surface protein